MTIEELLNQFRTDLYHAHGNLEISEQENERLKVEIQQLREALGEILTIADYYHDRQYKYSEMPYRNWTAIIDHTRKLLSANPK